MKFPDTKLREHVGNATGGRQAVMDQASIKYIFGYLSDLYSNRTLAAIRETSTNAWDSHVAAGVTRPIEVSLPSPMAPNLVIRDFGVGLDVEGVYTTFGVYGHSTKRDSDDFNGMLGLGSKALVTFVDQFTVTAVKDGIRSNSVVQRGEDGVLSVLTPEQSVRPTDEPNGVTVSIPVPDHKRSEVIREARDFFRHWTPGTVLVDGEAPAMDVEEAVLVLDESVYLTKHHGSSVIVMGNVAYELSYNESNRLRDFVNKGDFSLAYGVDIVAHVPVGSVAFTPSRESLDYTDLTKGTLRLLGEFVRDAITRHAQTAIESATSLVEAHVAREELRSALHANSLRKAVTWRGQVIPGPDHTVATPAAFITDEDGALSASYTGNGMVIGNIRSDAAGQTLVTGYPSDRVAGKRRAQLAAWLEDTCTTRSAWLVSPEQAKRIHTWAANTAKYPVVRWADIEAAFADESAAPRVSRTSTETSYPVLTEVSRRWNHYSRSSKSWEYSSRETVVSDLLADDRKLVYVTPDNIEREGSSIMKALPTDKYVTIVLATNRIDKAHRLLAGLVDGITVSNEERRAHLEAGSSLPESAIDLSIAHDLDPDDLLDPRFSFGDLADRVVQANRDLRDWENVCHARGWYHRAREHDTALAQEVREATEHLHDEYPLLRQLLAKGTAADAAEYVNALFFYRSEFATDTPKEAVA